MALSPLTARQPLSTLAETSPLSSSARREPLRRLRRHHTSPDESGLGSARRQYAYVRGQTLSPSPSPSPAKAKGTAMVQRTVFTELMMGAQRDKVKAKKRSEFVEDQAVESDEDDMLGFGGVRKKGGQDEDEDDEDDADEVVKNLVDDAHMNDSALAKAKVLEKHLEHQNADDAHIEKEMKDVVAGRRRTRKRGGAGGLLGSDGSDESEDDEEARVRRQRMAKKRRVVGDTLDELGRNPTTAPFHATYHTALVDDAEEFAYLDRDQGQSEEGGVEGGDDREPDEGEVDEEEEGGEGGGEQQEDDEDVEMAEPYKTTTTMRRKETVSTAEVRKTLLEVARGERFT
ncbi:MRC1-like domain-containing protein [Multifurca ochricompacta]|uniref:MRC1-like domain-containing protein n=1 Tax=Multifurca ochricompacta TaxID=376703 RepID=A0AAD4M4Y7_9AGAM|nr:MRC1-like domain-containing protein [Multifurca ochricompacta]